MPHLVSDYNNIINVSQFIGKKDEALLPSFIVAAPKDGAPPSAFSLPKLPDFKGLAEKFQGVLVIVFGAILLIVAVALITR